MRPGQLRNKAEMTFPLALSFSSCTWPTGDSVNVASGVSNSCPERRNLRLRGVSRRKRNAPTRLCAAR